MMATPACAGITNLKHAQRQRHRQRGTVVLVVAAVAAAAVVKRTHTYILICFGVLPAVGDSPEDNSWSACFRQPAVGDSPSEKENPA